ncbi:MAG: response regulator [Bacteroidota bacterium]
MSNDTYSNLHNSNILIVDDVPANLQLLGDILEGSGYKVREVLNGILALQVAEKEKPDLILLDIMMPDMDGFEVCRLFKGNQKFSDIPIIFISALNDTDQIVKALVAGGSDYITKPFQANEVRARVATHLKLYHQSKELQSLNETLDQRVLRRTRQLEAANKELAFHLREIEQFSFIASHDLQEPLLTITNCAQLVMDEYGDKLDENGNKSIAFIHGAANRMRLLVKGLMDYSLLGRDSLKTLIDCEKMVGEVLSELTETIEKEDAIVDVQKLPVVHGYEAELKLLFRNLLANALKYKKSECDPSIKISALKKGKDWIFSVKDNGIGMMEKDREKVFVIFKRLHNRDQYEGIGIGLALCKKIVELHGGNIWVESTQNDGSSFKFSIPAEPDIC